MTEPKKNIVFIATGSNLGDRRSNLEEAARHIEKLVGEIISLSHVYETEPWGHHDQPDFYNQVLEIKTILDPQTVMKKLLAIESDMGRIRTFKNDSRIIDIDILFYNSLQIKNTDITIPHPQIESRKFVLEPLNEIAPGFVHPKSKKTISQILSACTDTLKVFKIS